MISSPVLPTVRSPAMEVLFDRDLVTLYRGLETPECRAVIERFDRDGRKSPGRVYRQGEVLAEEAAVKNSWDLEIRDDGEWRDVFRAIHPRIQACIGHDVSRSPILQSFDLQATGYKVQMYRRGEGFFRWHADSTGAGVQSRQVAMILYLNDVAEGGETEFFHQGIQVAPRAGQLLLFPAGWNYMHRGQVPMSDDKYIVQTFVKIKDA
jgi:2OG-Fe(II) oxygenase superfamily